jgi:hypothetical protein
MAGAGRNEPPETVDTDAEVAAPVPANATASADVAPGAPGRPEQSNVSTPEYDPTRDRETKRGEIAMTLVWLLVFISLAPFVLALLPAVCAAVEAEGGATCAKLPAVGLAEILDKVLTPLVGLVGAVAGFYFGEKKT